MFLLESSTLRYSRECCYAPDAIHCSPMLFPTFTPVWLNHLLPPIVVSRFGGEEQADVFPQAVQRLRLQAGVQNAASSPGHPELLLGACAIAVRRPVVARWWERPWSPSWKPKMWSNELRFGIPKLALTAPGYTMVQPNCLFSAKIGGSLCLDWWSKVPPAGTKVSFLKSIGLHIDHLASMEQATATIFRVKNLITSNSSPAFAMAELKQVETFRLRYRPKAWHVASWSEAAECMKDQPTWTRFQWLGDTGNTHDFFFRSCIHLLRTQVKPGRIGRIILKFDWGKAARLRKQTLGAHLGVLPRQASQRWRLW